MMLNIDGGVTCLIYISGLWNYPWHDMQYYGNARRSCNTIVTIVVSASPSLMLGIPAMMYLMPMMIQCTIHSWCSNGEGTVLHSSTQNHWAWLYTCMRIVTQCSFIVIVHAYYVFFCRWILHSIYTSLYHCTLYYQIW